jgi:hypothetical protein
MVVTSDSPIAGAPLRETPVGQNDPRLRRWAKRALKIALGPVIFCAVIRHVSRVWGDLSRRGQSLQVDWIWIVVALALYLIGLGAFGAFFGRVVRCSSSQVRYMPALRAYLMSQVGKYVPGKAMVIVLRIFLLSPYGALPATTALATLYETSTMMAAGGLVAALVFTARPPSPLSVPVGFGHVVAIPLAVIGLGLAGGFLVFLEPRVFSRFLSVLRVPFPNMGTDAVPKLRQRMLGEGLLWSFLGWTLQGLSLLAVIRALIPTGLAATDWPLVVASLALASVSGFAVAIFPGGLVVREGVLMAALMPILGEDMAVIAALVLRLVWVLGEVLTATALATTRP